MKTLKLFLPLFALLILFSCKKNSSTPTTATATITATVDGTSQTYNVGAAGHLTSGTGTNDLAIVGLSSAGTGGNSLIIDINTSSPIVAGTYLGSTSQVDFSYTTSGGAIYQVDNSNSASNATVVITSITSTTVKGTFSGKLVLIYGSGPATSTFTNGAFNLAIK